MNTKLLLHFFLLLYKSKHINVYILEIYNPLEKKKTACSRINNLTEN